MPQERVHEIAHHGQVGLHLVVLVPSRDQPGLFEQGGVDHVGHVGEARGDGGAGVRIGEVDGHVVEG